MSVKTFPLRDILTVTTGRLLTKPIDVNNNGIQALYEILEFLCGEAPFTHSLPRFAEEARPFLLNEFPELASADTALLDEMMDIERATAIELWLDMCHSKWGMATEYALTPIPKDSHEVIDPITEMSLMMGVK